MRKETFALLACVAAIVFAANRAGAAGPFTVTTTADFGAGSLRQAILDANAANGGTINMNPGGPIDLLSPLPPVLAPTTVNGGGTEVRGNSLFRVFFVDVGYGGAVALNDLTIRNGRARGGNGGSGGGGGLGAGGGLFVSRGNVTVANVTFLNNAAVGGNGGAVGGVGAGGGGGLGGNGGNNYGGGGGYAGSGGSGYGDLTIGGGGGGGLDTNGQNGSGASGLGGGQGGLGPAFGGGTAYSAPATGGGGGSLASPASLGGNGGRFGGGGGGQANGFGGNGGDFGGGGAGSRGGAGGFGGGGGDGNYARGFGGIGGNGGFGGGGGGADDVNAEGLGGAFAGSGGQVPSGSIVPNKYNAGGGGAALGAQVFVRGGASLTLVDTATDQGKLTPGGEGTGAFATPGTAAGDGFFLSGATTISVSTARTRQIDGSIVDVGEYANHPTAIGFEYARITKTGGGTLVLSQPNTYRGGTIISQGTILAQASASDNLGPGRVTVNDANTASNDTTLLTGRSFFANPIDVTDNGTGTTTLGSALGSTHPVVFAGGVTLNRSVTFLAQNFTPLTALDETGQTRFDGPISGPGGVTITGGHMVQFRTGGKSYTGRTIVTGNSTLSLYDNVSAPANSTVQIDAGSTVVVEGLSAAVLGGLAGAGTLTHNPNWNPTSTLEVGRNNADTAFTGQITGPVILTKAGAGTLDLGPQGNTGVPLTVVGGRVRLIGDQLLQNLRVNDADPGTQALDLNGHTMRFNKAFNFILIALEDRLNHQIGTGADGVYDSTAAAHPGSAIGITYTPGAGQTLTMKLTLAGDANLDEKVDFTDLVILAQNYNTGSATTYWDNADFNYDHIVNFSDLVLLAQNYNGVFAAAAPIPGAPADFAQDLAAAFATVPEPASGLFCSVTGAFVWFRRRRTQTADRGMRIQRRARHAAIASLTSF